MDYRDVPTSGDPQELNDYLVVLQDKVAELEAKVVELERRLNDLRVG